MTFMDSLMKFLCCVLYSVCSLFFCSRAFAQVQACPLNSNFSFGSLTHWYAYTGNNKLGNGPGAILSRYDSVNAAPSGTIGATTIYEYGLPSTAGIQIINSSSIDPFGGFPTIPKINGYQYSGSVLLGSTAITHSTNAGIQGGYIRGISYNIKVPTSATPQPYTMTYAYAMVLENGSHNSNQQPLFSATLTTHDSVINCASPKYLLPTENNADPRGTGATLDSAAAIREGFSVSSRLSPNPNPNSNSPNAEHLQDVWTKGWREVTFDLSPYRGQQVTLTFEADNCMPGGHFAYAYVALRNNCDGLMISGPLNACANTNLIYSIPGLTGATYNWTIPSDWTLLSGGDSNIINVKVGAGPGTGIITARERNSCADLKDDIQIVTSPPTIAGAVKGDNEVCSGTNVSGLTLTGYQGSILNWLASPDGVSWNVVPNNTPLYTAQNLVTTTVFAALIQNGSACSIDTSAGARIIVDPKSVGGTVTPSAMEVCTGQDKDALLTLNGKVGNVLNWQSSTDNTNWNDLNPAVTGPAYYIVNLAASSGYRAIVKSGVCPIDISSVAQVTLLPALFPRATIAPADTLICYGSKAQLNASVSIGTNYTWTNTQTLTDQGNGMIPFTPFAIHGEASPQTNTNYVLSITNAGCPNLRKDTFRVSVYPRIIVDPGRDTSVVINQPLQLQASSNDTTGEGDLWNWTPVTGLNNPSVANPIAILGANIDSIRYFVTATASNGCTGTANLLVKVFKTAPDIFVPSAFTPGKSSNRIFRPIAVGISSLQYFRVYNRWGQLLYSSSQMGRGWDGTVNGRIQESGTYVWMAQGTAYTGKTVFRKGTTILIR